MQESNEYSVNIRYLRMLPEYFSPEFATGRMLSIDISQYDDNEAFNHAHQAREQVR